MLILAENKLDLSDLALTLILGHRDLHVSVPLNTNAYDIFQIFILK